MAFGKKSSPRRRRDAEASLEKPWVGQFAIDHARKFRERVRAALADVEEVDHRPAVNGEVVGDQPAMAHPPEPLGAHEGGRMRACQLLQHVDSGTEFRCRHEIGVGAERGHLPAAVARLLRPGELTAPAAERFAEPGVGNVGVR